MTSSQGGLVQYSDSDTDEDSVQETVEICDDFQKGSGSSARINQRKRKSLAVPDDIVHMFQDVESRKGAKRSNIDGRIRSFPHEEGDWPSYVYIPVNPCRNLESLMLAMIKNANVMLPGIKSIAMKDMHISLSRTVSLRHYWIENIVSQLKEIFTGMQSIRCHLDLVEIYTNDARTRSFLGFRIIIGEEQLKVISQRIDEVLEEFGLPKYYENPIFHVSFAWYLEDVTSMLPEDFLENLQFFADSFDYDLGSQDVTKDPRSFTTNSMLLKTGNKIYCLNGT